MQSTRASSERGEPQPGEFQPGEPQPGESRSRNPQASAANHKTGRGGRRAEAVRRLFVAAYPPSDAVEHLGRVVDGLEVSRANQPGRSTRVCARNRWHVTLAFLGDVRESRVEKVVRAVQRAAQVPASPIQISFSGAGTFGRGNSTILWTGLAGDVAALRALAATLRFELRRARLPFDPKPFRAHLTIARPGRLVAVDAIAADVATLRGYAGPLWPADRVHLVASELGPDPRYLTLASFPLGSPAEPEPVG